MSENAEVDMDVVVAEHGEAEFLYGETLEDAIEHGLQPRAVAESYAFQEAADQLLNSRRGDVAPNGSIIASTKSMSKRVTIWQCIPVRVMRIEIAAHTAPLVERKRKYRKHK